jgi:hypothetical protein
MQVKNFNGLNSRALGGYAHYLELLNVPLFSISYYIVCIF